MTGEQQRGQAPLDKHGRALAGKHGPDPVAQFFATHRAQVRDEPADDLTWQRITSGHRQSRRHTRQAWGAGLVAAVAAAAVVLGPGLLPDATPPVTGPASTSNTPANTAEEPTGDLPTGGPEAITAPIPQGELPQDGRLVSISPAGQNPSVDSGVRFALVSHPCAGQGQCATLADSVDGGLTLAPRADLSALGDVDRVLFVDSHRGWVWGAGTTTWLTEDGGTTWSPVDTGNRQVLDISVRDNELLATTRGTDCTNAACTGTQGALIRTDPLDLDWSDNVIADLGPVDQANILDAGDSRYLVTAGEQGSPLSVSRLQDAALESTATPTDCGSGPVAVTVAGPRTVVRANSSPTTDTGTSTNTGTSADQATDTTLYALCDDVQGLSLRTSNNGGRTWSPSADIVPSFVLGEQPSLIASSAPDHVLLIGDGNYTTSLDGGASWSPEAMLPGATGRPDRVEVDLFGDVILYPSAEQAGTDLAYWRSGDWGTTWEEVPLVP